MTYMVCKGFFLPSLTFLPVFHIRRPSYVANAMHLLQGSEILGERFVADFFSVFSLSFCHSSDLTVSYRISRFCTLLFFFLKDDALWPFYFPLNFICLYVFLCEIVESMKGQTWRKIFSLLDLYRTGSSLSCLLL